MSTFQVAIDAIQAAGGVAGIGLIVRGVWRRFSKVSQDRAAVDVTAALLATADAQATRLNVRLAEAEDRADRLSARIKELEAESLIRAKENATLTREIAQVRAQLVEAQLEAARLRGLLEMGEGP